MRYPAYRKFWFGTLASVGGFQMFQASQFWLVHHELDGSPLSLGLVGLFNAIPAIAFNLLGGVYADKLNKRLLIFVTQSMLAGLILLAATLTLIDAIQLWHVFAIAFVAGSVNAFDQPARQALYPQLIERKVMMSAVALNSSIWQGTRIVAPAVSGVIIALAGTEASFYVAAVGFFAMAAVMVTIAVPPAERLAATSPGRDMLDGLRYIKTNSMFSFLIGMTFFNSFFGMAYVIMMPVFAEEILGQGPEAYGTLLSAGGVGSLATSLYLGSKGNFRRKGLILIGGATMFGLTIAAFALTSEYISSYMLALALMVALGVFNSMYMVSIMSSLQIMVPNHMRGRIMGFYGMTYSIMPLGGLQAGAIASFIGVPLAIAIGGFTVSAFALGPALINRKVRDLGSIIEQFENAARLESNQDAASQASVKVEAVTND